MRDDVKYGAGCAGGMLGVGIGSMATVIGLIIAIWHVAGWITAGVGIAVLAGSAVFTAISAERAKQAASKAWAMREYKKRLNEIDELITELMKLATPERLTERGAADLQTRLKQLDEKKDQILASLLEIDRYLKDPKNRPVALQRERKDIELKLASAPDDVRPTLEQNLEAVGKTEEFLANVKSDREVLLANLDKILYGLRSSRAQMMAEVGKETHTKNELAGEMNREIDNDITEITSSLKAVDGMKAEIEDLTQSRAKKAASRQIQ